MTRGTSDFDPAAELYERVRPCYPEALYDDLGALSGVRPPARVLEIGCATGQASLPLAGRGYRLVCVDQGFFEVVQAVYRREAPELATRWRGLPHPEEIATRRAEIEATGLFGEVHLRRYLWDVTYDARDYVDLLATYADHRALPPAGWQRLAAGVRDLIDRKYGGRVVKTYQAVLHVAPKRGGA